MAADDPLKQRFEILRKRARQAATSSSQKEQEGLSRRFAQIGQVGSGAQIKAEAQASQRGAQRLQRAEETVGLAELGERQRLSEVKEARDFARGEREAGQKFAAGQAGLGRQFAARQAGLGRDFSAEQAGLQRKFQTGERLGAQDFAQLETLAGRTFSTKERKAAQSFADSQAAFARIFTQGQNKLNRALTEKGIAMQREAFDEGIRQFDLEFLRDTGTLAFNQQMAEDAASQTLLDELGFPPGISIGNLAAGATTGGIPEVLEAIGVDVSSATGGLF